MKPGEDGTTEENGKVVAGKEKPARGKSKERTSSIGVSPAVKGITIIRIYQPDTEACANALEIILRGSHRTKEA